MIFVHTTLSNVDVAILSYVDGHVLLYLLTKMDVFALQGGG
jgi:hypothetical protein